MFFLMCGEGGCADAAMFGAHNRRGVHTYGGVGSGASSSVGTYICVLPCGCGKMRSRRDNGKRARRVDMCYHPFQ